MAEHLVVSVVGGKVGQMAFEWAVHWADLTVEWTVVMMADSKAD